MKLTNRILLLIAPVILFSAAASTYIIYVTQKDALIKRTDSYLQLNMEKLAGYYTQANSLLSSYAYTLSKSDIIRHYFFHEINPFREMELVDNLHETINTLQSNNTNFVALSILDGNKEPLYYAEKSDDPFAKMDPLILKHIKVIYDTNHKTSYVGYSENSAGQGILLRYDVLDTKTLESPLSYNQNQIFFVVVYTVLNEFNHLRKQIEFDNKSSIFFSQKKLKKKGLAQVVQLQNGVFATLDPAPFILKNKLHAIQIDLLLAFSVSAFMTVLLLLLLLNKHVINPITKMDIQLREVENNKRRNIEVLGTNDEIGRLSSRFHAMYSELEDTYRRTKALAENDHLTKLANRHQFQRHAEMIIGQKQHHVWVLYIDLDNFKYVNDKYGHQIGDTLLVNFADHVKKLCISFSNKYQTYGLASRLSGDEFAILLYSPFEQPDCADQFASSLLEPIQSGENSPIGNFPITASIGIATYPDDGQHIEKLLSNADTAMYQAKNAGKNQIAHYSRELDKVVQRRSNIERALRAGNYDQEFSLVYQPYFTCKDNKVSGFEALLRWESETLGEVSPDEFIPIAEQTGLFATIDRWVIHQAFKEFHDIQAALGHPYKIAINLSSAELNSIKLADYIKNYSAKYDIPNHLIEFEITETFAAETQSFPLLHELSKQKFGLTIDDFGSGYTSIVQLVQYPVQKIKLDRVFLDTLIAGNKHNVVKPLIDLCHSQNMKVTAEGIESQDMNTWLADYNCDYLQGFYHGHPLSLEEISQHYGTNQIQENS
ncbi:putative bifunctional diguanylate cyclase/phosphodiesterase [Vibrio salinus]|uniref:putative bifunctional diguanylate cyclase/phosphodiesterase n=1 Tax=Vibrio salinus TaxID=2899784 RepID=UPI001E5D957C|nr:EAL domain-containing protein [Vibrio salinus]MCE0493215.1 EAL domain-containing protein [Vibrio salinus]